MPSDPKPKRGEWSVARGLSLGLALLLGLAAAGELGVRGWQRLRGEPFSPAAVEAELEETAAAMVFGPLESTPAAPAPGPDDVVPHPYLGWEPVAAREQYSREALHFADEEAAAAALDVLVVGGGGAQRFAVHGFAAFAGPVSRDPRYARLEVRCIDMAQVDAKQPHQLNTLNYVLGLGWRPDVVVNVDGFEEAVIGLDNFNRRAHPTHPSVVHMDPIDTSGTSDKEALDHLLLVSDLQLEGRAAVARCRELGLARSALLAPFALANMRELKERFDRATRAYDELLLDESRDGVSVRGPVFLGRSKAAVRCSVDVWAHASRLLAATCDARSIRYVHVLQPCEYDDGEDAGTKGDTEEEQRVWAVRTAYPEMRARGEDLRRAGVEFLDATGLFAEDGPSAFDGPSRLTPQGERLLGARIAELFLAGEGG